MSVSFVLPMFNEAENIADTVGCVAKLAGQISDDYEIIVADDASTDGSGDLVDRLAASDAHIKSVRLKTEDIIQLYYNSYNFESAPVIDPKQLNEIKITEN